MVCARAAPASTGRRPSGSGTSAPRRSRCRTPRARPGLRGPTWSRSDRRSRRPARRAPCDRRRPSSCTAVCRPGRRPPGLAGQDGTGRRTHRDRSRIGVQQQDVGGWRGRLRPARAACDRLVEPDVHARQHEHECRGDDVRLSSHVGLPHRLGDGSARFDPSGGSTARAARRFHRSQGTPAASGRSVPVTEGRRTCACVMCWRSRSRWER